MARINKIRYKGAIPERQHDAFLLALLIALCLNIAVVAIQAIMPKLAFLLELLGPERVELAQEEESYPFQLVDPSFLDEELDANLPVDAEARISHQARQAEDQPDLPVERAYIEEGVEEILTAPPGNPGPNIAALQSVGESSEPPAQAGEDGQAERQEESPPEDLPVPSEPLGEEQPVEPLPPVEDQPPPDTPEVVEPPLEMVEPAPPPVEPLPEMKEIPPEPAAPPEEIPEPPPEEPPPEETPVEEPPPEPAEVLPEPEPVAEPKPESAAEVIDVASLPMTVEGFFDPGTQRMEEIASRAVPPPPPERREVQPVPQVRPEAFQPRPEAVQPRRPGRRQPEIRRIGQADRQSSANAVSGGAPRRRNTSTRVTMLADDPIMNLLRSRYGEYMDKVARQLQESLYRVVALSPMSLSSGQVKIRFGISPDGSLTFYTTLYPAEGELVSERLISEQMLREAAPFDPLTQQMAADPNFQRLTVIVTLY